MGATDYEGDGPGTCNCRFADTYPYSFGPRLGASYRLNDRTVLRGGWGLTYAQTANGQAVGAGFLGAGGWKRFNFDPTSFGEPAVILRDGLSYDRDALTRVEYDAGVRPSPGALDVPPAWIHPDAGRQPRMYQWNITVQRELTDDFMVEAAYVGNRGHGFTANNLLSLNALSEERLQSFGLNVHSAADQALLRARLDSPLAAQRGFATLPYAGYSPGNTVAQSLRPFPQFGNLSADGVNIGRTWYDSLQVKGTKRYGKGLNLTATFTWQKEMTDMGPVNNVFAPQDSQKSISSLSEPLITVVAFSYELPAMGNGWVRTLVEGWTVGGMLRYASGLPIPVPTAQNQQNVLLFQNTRFNRVPGEPLFTHDLNGEFDPKKDFVLNPAAWVNPAPGEWGTSKAYYDDYRYQRRPDEQLTFGRTFRLKGNSTFQVRAEFFNAFDRVQKNDPVSNNPQQTQARNAQGEPIAGFGFVNTGSVYGPARSGQIVARVSF